MKRWIQSVSVLLLAIILIFDSVPFAMAAGSTIEYKGNKLFEYDVISQYTKTDLFDGFKNAMPGDTLTEVVTITNKAWKPDYIKVYMKAIPHDEEQNPITAAKLPGNREESVVSMQDFLSKLTIRLYQGNKKLYEGTPDATGGLQENVYLGKIRRLKSKELKVELEVPKELGNAYARRVGEVDWMFTVEAFDDPKDNPRTGDYIILAALIMMVASGTVLLILLLWKKRKKKNPEDM